VIKVNYGRHDRYRETWQIKHRTSNICNLREWWLNLPSSSAPSPSCWPLRLSFPSRWEAPEGASRLRSSSTTGITFSSEGSLSKTWAQPKPENVSTSATLLDNKKSIKINTVSIKEVMGRRILNWAETSKHCSVQVEFSLILFWQITLIWHCMEATLVTFCMEATLVNLTLYGGYPCSLFQNYRYLAI
jgi:hypothetical protein